MSDNAPGPQGHPSAPQGQWQPTNPPAPPVPVKQKSWFARHKILTGLGALLLIGMIGSQLGGGEGASSTAASGTATQSAGAAAPAAGAAAPAAAPAAQAEKPAAPGIGTKVRDGKFEFTVTGVEDGGTQVGNGTFGENAQGQFWLVHVTVSNVGDKPQMMFDSNQKVKDDQGREFAPNTMAAIHLGDSGQIWMKEINPGNTMQGTLVYDMPAGSAPATIQLHDSMFSGGVKVALK